MDSIYNFVDVILLTIKDGALMLAVVKREREPHAGVYDVIGGKIEVDVDGDARDAAMRITREKAGIESPYLEQLYTYTGKFRDQRKWSVAIAYYALVPYQVIEESRHPGVKLVAVTDNLKFPFDHNRMLEQALERLRSKGRYSSLPFHLVGEKFTLTQLQSIYEIVLGCKRHRANFRKKIEEMGIIEEVQGGKTFSGGKPSTIYRVKPEYRDRLTMLDRSL